MNKASFETFLASDESIEKKQIVVLLMIPDIPITNTMTYHESGFVTSNNTNYMVPEQHRHMFTPGKLIFSKRNGEPYTDQKVRYPCYNICYTILSMVSFMHSHIDTHFILFAFSYK